MKWVRIAAVCTRAVSSSLLEVRGGGKGFAKVDVGRMTRVAMRERREGSGDAC